MKIGAVLKESNLEKLYLSGNPFSDKAMACLSMINTRFVKIDFGNRKMPLIEPETDDDEEEVLKNFIRNRYNPYTTPLMMN